MNLAQALRVEKPLSMAFVGAGGKTTAMFRLARELTRKSETGVRSFPGVVLSASTHLCQEQLALSDHYKILRRFEDLSDWISHPPMGVMLFTGEVGEDQRAAGLPPSVLQELRDWALKFSLPFLVEADGARRKPLKAPAEHEPAIPTWIDVVILLAGLRGLGKPLHEEFVHRPEMFSRLSGLRMGDTINPEALVGVLSHAEGGLKAIPPQARRIVLFNQAGDLTLQAQAREMCFALLKHFDAALIADLKTERENADEVLQVHEKVAGILLAAGGSARMGRPKQTLLWQGKPLVRHVAEAARASRLASLVVVTGCASEEVAQALLGLDVQHVYNPDWQAGQSTSIRLGLEALQDNIGAAVFLLADQPMVTAQLIDALLDAHACTLAPIIAPLVQGARGNPVLFDRSTFSDLRQLQGDQGGRALFSHYPLSFVPWNDSRLNIDVDTPEEYQRLLEVAYDEPN